MADLRIEQLQYDLKDLERSVHMMMLGFDNLGDVYGVGCLHVVESQLEKIISSISEGTEEACMEG